MKKGILAMLSALFVVVSFTAPAFAASPHFIGTPTITKNPDFSLTADFKAAGLANIVTDIYLSSSGGSAQIQCQNPGGNNPPPKLFNFGPLEGQRVDVTPHNGQVSANPKLGPPPLPSASEVCNNPNWKVIILSVTYNDVVLHIQQNGVDILKWEFGNVDPGPIEKDS